MATKSAIVDMVDCSGRETLRRLVERKHGSLDRIATDAVEAAQMKPRQRAKRGQQDRQRTIALPQQPALVDARGWIDQPLVEPDRNRQSLSGLQPARRLEHVPAATPGVRVVRTGRALIARIGFGRRNPRARRKHHADPCSEDWKHPVIPGHIPVDLVIAVEIADLVPDAIADLIGMCAGHQKHVGIADANAVRVILGLRRVRFTLAIACHTEDVVAIGERGAVAFKITRQVAEYSPPDLVTLRRDGETFGDDDVTVLLHFDRDIEPVDTFLGARRHRIQRGKHSGEQRQQKSPERFHGFSDTCGAARSAVSISK